ncbi:MAG: aldo/keto reductase [Burkholderiaceae bacterium]
MHDGSMPARGRLWLGMMSFGDSGWAQWVRGIDAARPIFRRAIELGIDGFDTANFYSDGESERILGRLLAEHGVRDRVRIATKVGMPAMGGRGLAAAEIRRQVDGSLQRLGIDRIDLYQIHTWDFETPIDETLAALDALVDAGKIGAYGCSNLDAGQLRRSADAAAAAGLRGFATAQLQLNLLYVEELASTVPLCRTLGISVLGYSPLARGRLAGAAHGAGAVREATDAKAQRLYGAPLPAALDAALAHACSESGASRAEVAMAWALAQTGVGGLIIGALDPAELDVAVRASRLSLASAVLAGLGAAAPRREFLRVPIPRD